MRLRSPPPCFLRAIAVWRSAAIASTRAQRGLRLQILPELGDIVLVHGTLHFIAADRRVDVLARLRRSLAPGGSLVLLFNTSRFLAIAAPNAGATAVDGERSG